MQFVHDLLFEFRLKPIKTYLIMTSNFIPEAILNQALTTTKKVIIAPH